MPTDDWLTGDPLEDPELLRLVDDFLATYRRRPAVQRMEQREGVETTRAMVMAGLVRASLRQLGYAYVDRKPLTVPMVRHLTLVVSNDPDMQLDKDE